jgi:hypothetical protein
MAVRGRCKRLVDAAATRKRPAHWSKILQLLVLRISHEFLDLRDRLIAPRDPSAQSALPMPPVCLDQAAWSRTAVEQALPHVLHAVSSRWTLAHDPII